MHVKDRVGQYGEDIAARYLERQGMVVVARNWRCPAGEIDLVALDGDTVVVCEVKTRRGAGFGSGLEAVGREKQRRLRRLALTWVEASGRHGAALRIDVLAVVYPRNSPARIEHVRGAC